MGRGCGTQTYWVCMTSRGAAGAAGGAAGGRGAEAEAASGVG